MSGVTDGPHARQAIVNVAFPQIRAAWGWRPNRGSLAPITPQLPENSEESGSPSKETSRRSRRPNPH